MDPLFENHLFKIVEMDDKVYDELNELVVKTYSRSCILYIYEIMNPSLKEKFENTRSELSLKRSIRVEPLYHGTSKENILSISETGFDPKYNRRSVYGKGSYFSRFGNYSISYTDHDKDKISYMFIANVLVGKTKLGTGNAVLNTDLYDNFTDHGESMYVTPHRYGGIPKYIIAFYKVYS